ncbi:sensor histidine kinase [Kamptonema formosum]|uniref:sensor histidine kinase n=1 Tax=Kamptonema formosum TaxID=331992 RepID=UPI00034CCE98|nr:ATP-binding protein [Oscillatoria sp. PCC 10802]
MREINVLRAFGALTFNLRCKIENLKFILKLPHNHPERLPTFRGAVVWLALALGGFCLLAGVPPELLAAPALFAAGAMLPLPVVAVALLAGMALYGQEMWLGGCALAVGGAAVLGVLARRFLVGVEWELALRQPVGSLLGAGTGATPESVMEGALTKMRDLAGAGAAIAVRQLDEVTAEAVLCLPQSALLDRLITPRLFAEALEQNRCFYYSDCASAPGGARVLVARGARSIAVLPLQDVGGLRGAIVLIWYRPTSVPPHQRKLIESNLAALRTLLRFSDTTSHLEKLQARYGAILETIPQGVVFVDESGDQGWLNQAAAGHLGLAPGAVEPVSVAVAMAALRESADNRQAIAEQAVGFFSQPDAEIRDWVWVCRSAALGQRDCGGPTDSQALPAPAPDAQKVLSISSTPTRVRDVPGRLWLLDDITERYFSRLALVQRTAQLEAVNKELEAFSHSVAHDLRGPLAVIDGFSLLLLRDCADRLDADSLEDLQRIRGAAERMGQLIDDLLQLARVTRAEMKRQPVDLSAMVAAIARDLKDRHPERQVELAIAPGVVATADGRLVQIALENLLGNAWKYTSKRPRARIEFGVGLQSPQPTYFVRDDGAGFDMAQADKLFAAFVRLHDSADFEGTGVGLATVQRILHRHGGRIWAEAAVERGATFYFTL